MVTDSAQLVVDNSVAIIMKTSPLRTCDARLADRLVDESRASGSGVGMTERETGMDFLGETTVRVASDVAKPE